MRLVLLLESEAAIHEHRYLLRKSILFSVVARVLPLIIDQVLHHFFLVQDEVHHLLFLQLHELEQERVPVCVDMVDVGSALDQAPGQLRVEVAGEHHVHQDGAAVLVLLIDAVGVE